MLISLGVLVLVHVMAWAWSCKRGMLDGVRLLRGPSVAAVALLSLPLSAMGGMRAVLIAVFALLWGIRRTAFQLLRERMLGPSRFLAAWQRQLGPRWAFESLWRMVLPQALVLWVCSLPIQRGIIFGAPLPGSVLDALAVVLLSIGMGLEALSDHQLLDFQCEEDGRSAVFDGGVWGWSRNPNLFGLLLCSGGFFLWAASAGDGLWSALGPVATLGVVMTFLVRQREDPGMTERRPGYERYRRRTSKLFPMPSRDPGTLPMPAETLRYLDKPDSERRSSSSLGTGR